MDFVGELNRFAVLAATRRDVAAVEHARETVDQLQSQLMQFDFRNGQLRKKFDGIKYTVKKLEQMIYELSLASTMGGYAPGSHEDDGEPAAKRARTEDEP